MKQICLSVLLALLLTGCGTSVGIIGGADGPTSIVVAARGGDGAQLEYYDEMPSPEDIPTPPGTFGSAWEQPEEGIMTIITEDISEDTFENYLNTLAKAGYASADRDSIVEVSGGKETQIDTVRCEGSGGVLELSYDYGDKTLVCIIDQD
ncbi:MAG: hypothetical protein IJ480_10375 [Clostridia bacterium]|nr:hypothetical protein [Clostridia bacterium]